MRLVGEGEGEGEGEGAVVDKAMTDESVSERDETICGDRFYCSSETGADQLETRVTRPERDETICGDRSTVLRKPARISLRRGAG